MSSRARYASAGWEEKVKNKKGEQRSFLTDYYNNFELPGEIHSKRPAPNKDLFPLETRVLSVPD